jgi:hypothetical protein
MLIKMWQDIVLSGVGIVFTLILIPQLKDSIDGKSQLNLFTSSITGIGCFIICLIDMTLNLHIAAAVSLITGLVWLSFFGLAYRTKNNTQV